MKKKLKRFNEYMVNESLPPHDPNIGFYDMSNGNMKTLVNLLNEKDIKYDYDSNRNYLTIEVDISDLYSGLSAELAKNVNETGGNYITFDNAIIDDYMKDPNNVILITRKKYVDNSPPGAYH
jgi:hypothetical protein